MVFFAIISSSFVLLCIPDNDYIASLETSDEEFLVALLFLSFCNSCPTLLLYILWRKLMVDSARDGRRDLITSEATKQAPPAVSWILIDCSDQPFQVWAVSCEVSCSIVRSCSWCSAFHLSGFMTLKTWPLQRTGVTARPPQPQELRGNSGSWHWYGSRLSNGQTEI